MTLATARNRLRYRRTLRAASRGQAKLAGPSFHAPRLFFLRSAPSSCGKTKRQTTPRIGQNKAQPASQERLLDVKETASMLGVKPSTLYQWAYERRLPVVKLFGRALRFRLSDIEKLIADSVRPALQ